MQVNTISLETGSIAQWVRSFLFDRRAQRLAPNTLRYYSSSLGLFKKFCIERQIRSIETIPVESLRGYMIWLDNGSRNPGGLHGHYRVLKVLMNWYWEENGLPEGTNPIRRLKPPKVPHINLEPVGLEVVSALLRTCKQDRIGLRDRALLLALLETGARASELLAIDLSDLDLDLQKAFIRRGKGGDGREVYFGVQTRRALRAYIRVRASDSCAVFLSKSGERLTYWGLSEMLKRRSRILGIKNPGAHAFRRQFALSSLLAGIPLQVLMKLTGHRDLTVLSRYLKITPAMAREEFLRAGAVGDRLP